MPKQTKTCRVCGATYEACRSVRTGSDSFNWREVACSPECGMVYLERVMASRNKSVMPAEEQPVVEPTAIMPEQAFEKQNVADVTVDESDELFTYSEDSEVTEEE